MVILKNAINGGRELRKKHSIDAKNQRQLSLEDFDSIGTEKRKANNEVGSDGLPHCHI